MSVLQLVSAWAVLVLVLYGIEYVLRVVHTRSASDPCRVCGHTERYVGENGMCTVCEAQYKEWFTDPHKCPVHGYAYTGYIEEFQGYYCLKCEEQVR